MKLSFFGADRTVTGSCHMVECAGLRILIDCGLFQGSRELDEDNAEDFGFDPTSVDLVLLTHAHLDHCGRLPLLVKRGFKGEIVSTSATAELARIVMVDAAHLHEEDARFLAKKLHNGRAGNKAVPPPLYTIIDALNTVSHFGRVAKYGQPLELAPGFTATYVDAGHILGSASIRLEYKAGGKTSSVLYSGDLGKATNILLVDPPKPLQADAVVMETTYGNRNHRALDASVDELYDAITQTFMRGGNVVVPTFAIERAQEVIYCISQGLINNRLPPQAQVYVDSPMAISVTEVMERNLACLQPAVAEAIRKGHDPFHFQGLHLTRDHAASVAINDVEGGAIILAGSGMCTGGRIRHHLRQNLPRANSSVVFVGFAAGGTLARRIIDGEKEVGIFGEHVPVKAQVYTINGFSAHADQQQLLAWHAAASPSRTFLVHGEESTSRAFAGLLKNTKVDVPAHGESFEI